MAALRHHLHAAPHRHLAVGGLLLCLGMVMVVVAVVGGMTRLLLLLLLAEMTLNLPAALLMTLTCHLTLHAALTRHGVVTLGRPSGGQGAGGHGGVAVGAVDTAPRARQGGAHGAVKAARQAWREMTLTLTSVRGRRLRHGRRQLLLLLLVADEVADAAGVAGHLAAAARVQASRVRTRQLRRLALLCWVLVVVVLVVVSAAVVLVALIVVSL